MLKSERIIKYSVRKIFDRLQEKVIIGDKYYVYQIKFKLLNVCLKV